ncbi:OsmC family protein [Rapidithrix thailandica]|uniref:OsmC family protein n=1 Tax=Rapidithrix thailandica TaxID=413964 RepID=A0AAW9S8I8_9BACT
MSKLHKYKMTVEWTGNEGKGTSGYKSYNRNHNIRGIEKPTSIDGSSDPNFLGDKNRYNPEELFLSSLAACHMLWYLHLCASNNIIVLEYVDAAKGTMEETSNGSGRFTEVMLNPKVTVSDERMIEKAIALHHDAHKMCFIANSCNFPIFHTPIIKTGHA